MSSTILLICKSCHRSSEELPEGARSDGTLLLEQLQADFTESTSIKLHPVNCLWVCDHGCAAAFSCANKATYLFSDLPVEGSAEALQEFAKLYANSKKGHIPWEQFPAVFQTVTIAKIPALSDMGDPNQLDEND